MIKLWNWFIDWFAGPGGWLIVEATPAEQNDLSHLDLLDGRQVLEPVFEGISIEDHIHNCERCQQTREIFAVEQNDYPA